eukprot:TRINITY_DN7306_c0_g1_i1.p2 TRINITY_DN7306_c0_g1~~TRINITY_DN7306_c0_g1_i1.p2  ORF type:complete len:316 (+),score=96.05 TRINITY_DN7306_c0_g1_i1:69-950(+)
MALSHAEAPPGPGLRLPFATPEDAARRRGQISAAEVSIPWAPRSAVCRLVSGLLSPDDCAAFAAAARAAPPASGAVGGAGGATPVCSVDDPAAADWLARALEPVVPSRGGGRWALARPHHRVTVVERRCGGATAAHHWGSVAGVAGERARVCARIWLDEAPRQRGGAMVFVPSRDDSADHPSGVTIHPERGGAVVFSAELAWRDGELRAGPPQLCADFIFMYAVDPAPEDAAEDDAPSDPPSPIGLAPPEQDPGQPDPLEALIELKAREGRAGPAVGEWAAAQKRNADWDDLR